MGEMKIYCIEIERLDTNYGKRGFVIMRCGAGEALLFYIDFELFW
jgi:hypothetical protein